MPVPTVADIARIAGVGDPVVRNLQITQAYHELSVAIAARVGRDANWCTFATWASRQAGDTIRGEDMRKAAERVLGAPSVLGAVERLLSLAARSARIDTARLRADVLRIVDVTAPIQRASAAVSDGNRKVFVEIAHTFARWLADCVGDQAAGGPSMRAFCSTLTEGEPPEGQRLLREAFTAYAEAQFASDEDARQESLLLANLLIGMHEQTRLQPEIRASMDAGFLAAEVKERLLARLLPSTWLRTRAALSRALARPMPLDEAVDALVEAVQREMRHVITESLMTLRLPGGDVVRLGRDVAVTGDATVRTIGNPQLVALLQRVDPRDADAWGSGASDWSQLPQRMHFISELFRAYQRRSAMFDPPFSPQQVAQIVVGRVPAGPL